MIFTKKNIDVIREDIRIALDKIPKDRNVEFELGSISFNSTSFTAKLTCRSTDESAVASREANEEMIFKALAVGYGGHPDWFGKKFTFKGVTYTITGINTKAKKNPFNLKADNGKEYRCPAGYIRARLGGK